jgi:hypothetical protein
MKEGDSESFQESTEDSIPEFTGHSEASFTVSVMVDHVVLLHVLKVVTVDFIMMRPVVDHVIAHIAKHSTGHDRMVAKGRNENGV